MFFTRSLVDENPDLQQLLLQAQLQFFPFSRRQGLNVSHRASLSARHPLWILPGLSNTLLRTLH